MLTRNPPTADPRTRDGGVSVLRTVSVGAALAGMTVTGALAGLFARQQAAEQEEAAPAPPPAAASSSPQAGASAPGAASGVSATGATPPVVHRVLVVVEAPAATRQGAPRQSGGVSAAAQVRAQPPAPPAPAPVVRAPEAPAEPAATSSGSDAP